MEALPEPDPTPATRQRKRYPPAFKAELVALATRPDVSVSALAREHGVNANQLFKWIRAARLTGEHPKPASGSNPAMLLVTVPTQDRSARSVDRAALEIALPRATLRFGSDGEPTRVATLLRLLGS